VLYTDCYQNEELNISEQFSEDQIFNLAIKEEQRIFLNSDDFVEDKEDR